MTLSKFKPSVYTHYWYTPLQYNKNHSSFYVIERYSVDRYTSCMHLCVNIIKDGKGSYHYITNSENWQSDIGRTTYINL